MKKGTYVRQRQADALDIYWKSQTHRLNILENFVKQGGSVTPELCQTVEGFEAGTMAAYEKMIRVQKQLAQLVDTASPTPSQPQTVEPAREAGNPWANPVIDALDLENPETIKRFEAQVIPCEETKRGESALPKSGVILMLGDEDAYGKALKSYLLEHGLQVHHIERFLTEEEAEAQVASAAQTGEIAGLVVLGNKYYSAEKRDCYYGYILTVFFVVKQLVIHIRAGGKKDRQYLFLFNTFLDGRLGMTGTSEAYHYGAFNGMAKCMGIELYSFSYVKEIDFEPGMSADTMIAYLDDELRCHEPMNEVGRTADGVRHRLSNVLTRSVVTENRSELTENDVLLVSGGARGVTAECIFELAKRVKCSFVLLGRAKILEENNDDEETAKITDLRSMKVLLAKRYKAQGFKGSLSVIEKKANAILNQRDMLSTFEKIRATGNQVFYYSCDVNDRENMTQTIAQIQNEVGKITGVVHGAGIVADCKIWNKEKAAFCRVFDTKYKGLNNIMDNVDMNTLKLLVMFSSVSGFFGNDGQFDYVAANEYMDKYAYYIRRHYPHCRALAINWGAWNGGMVNLDTLYINTLKERGFILIPLEVGANYFANEFLMGLPIPQMLINNTGKPAIWKDEG